MADAISSGFANRPSTAVGGGGFPWTTFSRRGVTVEPGATVFTLIPRLPYSRAAQRASPITACFEVVYAAVQAPPRVPLIDEILTMLPPSAKCRSSARMEFIVPGCDLAQVVLEQEGSICPHTSDVDSHDQFPITIF